MKNVGGKAIKLQFLGSPTALYMPSLINIKGHSN